MNNTVKMILLFVGGALLIAGNAYFYFTEKAGPLSDVEFTLLDGNKITADELKGNTVLLNFWATSCEPCRKEIPELIELHQEFSKKNVKLIGVAMSHDRPDHVIAFKQKYQIPYAIALDVDSLLAQLFKVKVIPVTLLISPHGQIVYRHSGVININDLRKRITDMLPEKGA